MKFLRFGAEGAERPGAIDKTRTLRDISSIVDDITPRTIAEGQLARLSGVDLERLPYVPMGTRIGPPIAWTGNFIGVGLNYADHAAEIGQALPKEPILFSKAPNCICGPNDPIRVPPGSVKLDWEVELAIVIGRRAYNIPESAAMSAILGFTICNDLSERAWQLEGTGQWMKGKCAPTFGPIGPWLITPDEAGDIDNLDMFLDVDGERMQTGNTKTLVFKVPFLVSYISRFMQLEPGDIITTGTPPGVGMGKKPPRFLRPGQEVRLGVGGLGEQRAQTIAG
ncbi:MAG: fumarylacetoacetate hydrolase family protein [Bauldia sp.]